MAPGRIFALALVLASGCASFDGPPEPSIEGLQEGLLTDVHAPIVVAFSKPPEPRTIKLEIATTFQNVPQVTLFRHDPVTGDSGGTAALAADGSTMTITPSVPLPVAASLAVFVEPGLSDAMGTATVAPRELSFGYASTRQCDAPTHVMRPGVYFYVTAVDQPVPTQITTFTVIEFESATGTFKSQLTKAKRNPDPTRCTPACADGQVCRLLPAPACVLPSTPADSADEFSDYVPNPMPPTGYSVFTTGCAVDQNATTATVATNPVDIQTQSPMITLRSVAQTSAFVLGTDGTLRGTGTLTADAVLLGTTDAGQGHGTLTARSIDGAGVPPGIPPPP